VREILERQELGHLTFRVDVPDATYNIQGIQVEPGVYRIKPSLVALTEDAAITVNFSIRYPVLSGAQYAFLRNKKDYRFVYGLIAGIVRHEGRHERALTAYVNELRGILAAPVTGDFTIQVASPEEFQKKATAELGRILEGRVAAARVQHEQAQAGIDDPTRIARIEFVFEEEVNGEVPPHIIAEFVGEGQFSFTLPPGPVLRPPVPNIPL
jgi:hypothetical protein